MEDRILHVACEAARLAGAIQRERYETLLNVDAKTRHDVKLEVDRMCEQAVIERIRKDFPAHAILAEERGNEGGDGDCLWIIDPLDGTVNYYYGLPYFCCSVACYRRTTSASPLPRTVEDLGEGLAAAVYAPRLDEMFCASAGQGAWLNGTPIRASSVERLDDCIVATGYGSTPERIDCMQARGQALVGQVRKIRCLGAAALDICLVACGRLSAFVERGIRAWDLAAGALIVREAGGRFHAVEYAENEWDVLASGAEVHDDFLRLLKSDPCAEDGSSSPA